MAEPRAMNRASANKWLVVLLAIGGPMLFLSGCAIALCALIPGTSLSMRLFLAGMGLFGILMGGASLWGLLQTLAVYSWDGFGIRKKGILQSCSMRWEEIVESAYNTRRLDSNAVELKTRTGERMTVHLTAIQSGSLLEEVLWERLRPLRERKAAEVLSRPTTTFLKRCWGTLGSSVVFDGIRLCIGKKVVILGNIRKIELTHHYYYGIKLNDNCILTEGSGQATVLPLTVENADVLLEVIRRQTPEAIWVDLRREKPDDDMSAELDPRAARETLISRIAHKQKTIAGLWGSFVVILAFVGWQLYNAYREGKDPLTTHRWFALGILGAAIAAICGFFSWRIWKAHRETVRLRKELREMGGGAPKG